MINYKIKNKEIDLILCILGGWFGLHYFCNKKISLGILYFCTFGLFGIGWIIDIIKIINYKEKTSENNSGNNDKANDYDKHIVDINNNQEKFECEIIKTNYRLEFKEFIDTLIYFDELDKDGLYEGYSDKEITELGIKIYMCENTSLPCEITWNENNYHYELKYTGHSNDYYFGYIPEEHNETISKIINNKEIIHGGMRFEHGYFKEYNFEKDKVIKGYDEIKVFINLLYK